MNFIPTNLHEKFTEKLFKIEITQCDLTEIGSRDLQFHIKLKIANFSKNLITVLMGDVFDSNKNLQIIDLSSNPIHYIEASFFAKLAEMFSKKQLLFFGHENISCIIDNKDTIIGICDDELLLDEQSEFADDGPSINRTTEQQNMTKLNNTDKFNNGEFKIETIAIALLSGIIIGSILGGEF